MSDELKIPEGLQVAFGLQAQGHIPLILHKLADAGNWDDIGKAIGWHPETAHRHFEWWIDAQTRATPTPAPKYTTLSEVLCLYQDVANAAERLHVAINLAEENYDAWHGKKGTPPSHEVQQKLSAECVAAEEGLTAALAKLRAGR